jgi:hypothetical protein
MADALNADLFPEQIEILLKSEDESDLNHMLSSLNIKQLTANQYHWLRARERQRKRAAGEDVPTRKVGRQVTLAKDDRATCGQRCCQTLGCKKNIQFRSNGKGWCSGCCPSEIKIVETAPRKAAIACTHVNVQGVRCTKRRQIGGLCLTHCPNDDPKKVAHNKKEAERNAKRRKHT